MLHFIFFFLLHQSAPLFFGLHQYAIAPQNKHPPPPPLLKNIMKNKKIEINACPIIRSIYVPTG